MKNVAESRKKSVSSGCNAVNSHIFAYHTDIPGQEVINILVNGLSVKPVAILTQQKLSGIFSKNIN